MSAEAGRGGGWGPTRPGGDLRSALYTGAVRHRRFSPVENRFRYGVFQLLIDLDELPRLDREVRGFGYNRAAIASFHDEDHLGSEAAPVREKLDRWLRARGRSLEDEGPVRLLANPRVLGYVFNPVSYFYCFGADGELRFTVAEVRNTFGEAYGYLLDGGEALGGRATRYRREKRFHVSPFIGMEGVRYDWILTPPGERLTVHIDERRDGKKFFDATLTLRRRPLSGRSLAGALLRYPHMTARTMCLIHWQALRLWRKRVPRSRKPPPPADALEGT